MTGCRPRPERSTPTSVTRRRRLHHREFPAGLFLGGLLPSRARLRFTDDPQRITPDPATPTCRPFPLSAISASLALGCNPIPAAEQGMSTPQPGDLYERNS